MRVVLFCGGLGMRLREYSDTIPKPMVKIGNRPILWHLMKYYSHFGHKEFILCLGHKADVIRDFFLNFNECYSNDFALSEGGAKIELFHHDIRDWRITLADTGLSTNIAGRLLNVRHYFQDDDVFLANYSDNLSDLDLGQLVNSFLATDAIAGFVAVKLNTSMHIIDTNDENRVLAIQSAAHSSLWANGGFFVFRREVFDYIEEGEELVEEPFQRLIDDGKLFAFKHPGFWACMDTYKEKQQLEDLYERGYPPWQVWNRGDSPNRANGPITISRHSVKSPSR